METKEMYGYYVPSETEQEEILNEKKRAFPHQSYQRYSCVLHLLFKYRGISLWYTALLKKRNQ